MPPRKRKAETPDAGIAIAPLPPLRTVISYRGDGVLGAVVHGDGLPTDVRYSRMNGWYCACGPVSGPCRHIEATRAAIPRPVEEEENHGYKT